LLAEEQLLLPFSFPALGNNEHFYWFSACSESADVSQLTPLVELHAIAILSRPCWLAEKYGSRQ
jgi:hypothetical protein